MKSAKQVSISMFSQTEWASLIFDDTKIQWNFSVSNIIGAIEIFIIYKVMKYRELLMK